MIMEEFEDLLFSLSEFKDINYIKEISKEI